MEQQHEQLIAIRRDIHAHPEIAFEETRTADLVAKQLQQWGIEVHRGLGKTGLVGVLHGARGKGHRAIGLRADMDALPMPEYNQFPHTSQNAGRMHGCGHDGHTTMLLGAVQYLAQHRDFEGTVNFIFQPAEEGGNAGARAMMADGLFERFPCDEIYGIHNLPEHPVGWFGVCPGPMMASSNRFDITIRGIGGHAATPEKTVDSIVIAAEMIGALQTLISRRTSPFDTAVLSITQVHAGDAYNVIPDHAVIRGTVRTFSLEVLDALERDIGHIVHTLPQVHGASGELKFIRAYPPVINHAAQANFAADVAATLLDPQSVERNIQPVSIAEDFAFYLEAVPGSYLFLGNGDGAHRTAGFAAGPCRLHTPSYDFNDALLPIGASYWVRLVEAYFARA
ncbi:MAG TPA: M20 aminoacylase family protein [Burkholderiaceae bacterium]